MNCLLRYSIENKLPIDLIYINKAGDITHRTVIVRKITVNDILVFDLNKQQLRSFKRAKILSAAKTKQRRRINYA